MKDRFKSYALAMPILVVIWLCMGRTPEHVLRLWLAIVLAVAILDVGAYSFSKGVMALWGAWKLTREYLRDGKRLREMRKRFRK